MTRCTARLAGYPDTVQCIREEHDCDSGHVFHGRSVPDAHDDTEPHGDDQ